MSRRRKVFLLLALMLLLLPLLVVGGVIARAVFFPPTFDVPTIAAEREHKDAQLLARAWALPVAASYGSRLDYQTNGSVCGPSSLANTFRSLGVAQASEAFVLAGTGKCRTGICFMGLTLDELAEIAAAKSGRRVTVVRDVGVDELRDHLRRANDPARRTIANFHRGLLFGKGTGHHSPIGGYLEDRDLVFVLDVNEKFGPWLVSTARLHRAIDEIDGATGKKRGLLVLE
jgi:hypothetical protein